MSILGQMLRAMVRLCRSAERSISAHARGGEDAMLGLDVGMGFIDAQPHYEKSVQVVQACMRISEECETRSNCPCQSLSNLFP